MQSAEDVAAVIQRSRGPSGENSEYLVMLETALTCLGSESGDEHVNDLARRVRMTEAGAGLERVVDNTHSKLEHSHDVQEETEEP